MPQNFSMYRVPVEFCGRPARAYFASIHQVFDLCVAHPEASARLLSNLNFAADPETHAVIVVDPEGRAQFGLSVSTPNYFLLQISADRQRPRTRSTPDDREQSGERSAPCPVPA